jgi:hemoglobin-like flavoprotein
LVRLWSWLRQVELVKSSFESLKPVAGKFVSDFYDKLLGDHPELKPYFANTDMKGQHAKLISALIMLVQDLQDASIIKPKLLQLG